MTAPAVLGLADMETPNTLQESKTRVSSSGDDKSAYPATDVPVSISVEEPPLWPGISLLQGAPPDRSSPDTVGGPGGSATLATPQTSHPHREVGHSHSMCPLTSDFLPTALLFWPVYPQIKGQQNLQTARGSNNKGRKGKQSHQT